MSEANHRAPVALAFLERLRAGDSAGASELVMPEARHHNPYFAAGMRALIAAATAAVASAPNRVTDVKRVIGAGEYVVIHSHVRHHPEDRGISVVHIFRFDGDRIAELWDVGQPIPAEAVNVDGMF